MRVHVNETGADQATFGRESPFRFGGGQVADCRNAVAAHTDVGGPRGCPGSVYKLTARYQ
jgi:hypothetical protein